MATAVSMQPSCSRRDRAKRRRTCAREGGGPITVEIWALPAAGFGDFIARIPAPLGVGKLSLEDGTEVTGFLCESTAIAGQPDITAHGGWRAYRQSVAA